jgi:hypothetical protein
MTTLVLDKKTERTAFGDVLNSITDSVVEIRNEQGSLVALLTLPGAEQDDVDYAPHLAWAEEHVAELDRRARDKRPGVTTEQLLQKLQQRETPA